MAAYTKFNANTIEKLICRYGFDEVLNCYILDGGSANTNYYIETKTGNFVLTICDEKSFHNVRSLANLLSYLEKETIYTSQIVIALNGEKVISHNAKPVMLKKYIEGEVCNSVSEQVILQLGEIISNLHQLSAPDYLPDSFPYGAKYFNELLTDPIQHPFIDWLSLKNKYIEKNIPRDLPKALIHGDIFTSNIIVKENKLIAIMDYEEACYYYRMFDLGMAIVGTCRAGNDICFKKAKQLISGYCKIQALQPIEKEKLQIFVMYGAVSTAFWRFRQHHIIHNNVLLQDDYLEMQNLANTIIEYPALRFTELFGSSCI